MGMSDYMRVLREKVGQQLLEVPSASIVVRDGRGRVLLVKHSDTGTWAPPGGAIEPLETPANAAVREMWEETGLHVRLTRLAGVFGGADFVVTYPNGDRTSYAMTVFEADAIGGEPKADGDEILEARFFAPEELDRLDIPAWLPEVLSGVFEEGDRAKFRKPDWAPAAPAG